MIIVSCGGGVCSFKITTEADGYCAYSEDGEDFSMVIEPNETYAWISALEVKWSDDRTRDPASVSTPMRMLSVQPQPEPGPSISVLSDLSDVCQKFQAQWDILKSIPPENERDTRIQNAIDVVKEFQFAISNGMRISSFILAATLMETLLPKNDKKFVIFPPAPKDSRYNWVNIRQWRHSAVHEGESSFVPLNALVESMTDLLCCINTQKRRYISPPRTRKYQGKK